MRRPARSRLGCAVPSAPSTGAVPTPSDQAEDIAAALRNVEEGGFVCPELDKLLATEPLDRWSALARLGEGEVAGGSSPDVNVRATLTKHPEGRRT